MSKCGSMLLHNSRATSRFPIVSAFFLTVPAIGDKHSAMATSCGWADLLTYSNCTTLAIKLTTVKLASLPQALSAAWTSRLPSLLWVHTQLFLGGFSKQDGTNSCLVSNVASKPAPGLSNESLLTIVNSQATTAGVDVSTQLVARRSDRAC